MKASLMHRKVIAVLLGAGLALCALPLAAQTADTNTGDAGTGGEAAEPFDSSDFFGDSEQQTATEVQSTEKQSENFLSEEGVKWGGSYSLSITTGTMYKRDYADWTGEYLLSGGTFDAWDAGTNDDIENSSLALDGSLWFSARPSEDVRYYGKLLFDYPFSDLVATYDDLIAATDGDSATTVSGGAYVPNISIWELFADFNIDSKVFIRAGKQTVKWGVGYFFQPTDVISLTAVDVLDPTADREGPLAIKANIPLGIHNLDFYALAPSGTTIDSITDIGLAGRFKFVLDAWEFSLGALYQTEKDWNFTATASGGIGDFSFFGEALVNRLSSGNYLTSGDTTVSIYNAALGMSVPVPVSHTLATDRTDWFFSGTAGAMYSNSDNYLTAIAQYYYNGEGYDNAADIAADALKYIAAGKMTVADLMGNTGKHYGSAYVKYSFVKDSPVAVSILWIGNLSDGSGMIKPIASFDITDQIALSVSPYLAYGPENTQYRGFSKSLTGSDSLVYPTGMLSVTLSLANGKF